MTEKFLHYLWGSKQFPIVNTRLTNGEQIVVKHVGDYNENLKGPDFSFGSVSFNGITEFGPIELHLKSSDWYKHNHHLDDAYNNVILHVVYEDDQAIVQNGRTLPTLELREFIKDRELKKATKSTFFDFKFPCANRIDKIDEFHKSRMIDLAFIEKMSQKKAQIKPDSIQLEGELLYRLVVLAFGRKVNQHLFLELLRELPYELMILLKDGGNLLAFMNSLKVKLSKSLNWHAKGVRPNGFPEVRINQLIEFIQKIDFVHLESLLEAEVDVTTIDFYNVFNDVAFSKRMKNHLVINAFAPCLWIKGERLGNEVLQTVAVNLLTMLPSEDNKEVKSLSKVFGKSKNAYESQGLMALNRYFCSRKKCLSCDIGNKVLNRL